MEEHDLTCPRCAQGRNDCAPVDLELIQVARQLPPGATVERDKRGHLVGYIPTTRGGISRARIRTRDGAELVRLAAELASR